METVKNRRIDFFLAKNAKKNMRNVKDTVRINILRAVCVTIMKPWKNSSSPISILTDNVTT